LRADRGVSDSIGEGLESECLVRAVALTQGVQETLRFALIKFELSGGGAHCALPFEELAHPDDRPFNSLSIFMGLCRFAARAARSTCAIIGVEIRLIPEAVPAEVSRLGKFGLRRVEPPPERHVGDVAIARPYCARAQITLRDLVFH
jgi:hypothetical protein